MKSRSMATAVVLAATLAAVPGARAQVSDPLEPVNRAIFNFNDKFDQYIFKPVAQTYVNVVPSLVRRGVSNVFGNISDASPMLIACGDLFDLPPFICILPEFFS